FLLHASLDDPIGRGSDRDSLRQVRRNDVQRLGGGHRGRRAGFGGLGEPRRSQPRGGCRFHLGYFNKYSAAWATSLSPRPERLATMIWSGFIFGATFSTWAMACDDSSAGMIPSMRASF